MKRLKLRNACLAAIVCIAIGSTAYAQGLDDPTIAHIAYTAGEIDIRYAHLALALSDNPKVREFATLMVRDHTAVNEKALALVKKLNVTPKDNPTSQQLDKQAIDIRNELRALSGGAFDKRYAANELSYHQFVNKAVETQFIPGAKNEEFKELLRQALAIFKAHEAHAAEMVRGLNQ